MRTRSERDRAVGSNARRLAALLGCCISACAAPDDNSLASSPGEPVDSSSGAIDGATARGATDSTASGIKKDIRDNAADTATTEDTRHNAADTADTADTADSADSAAATDIPPVVDAGIAPPKDANLTDTATSDDGGNPPKDSNGSDSGAGPGDSDSPGLVDAMSADAQGASDSDAAIDGGEGSTPCSPDANSPLADANSPAADAGAPAGPGTLWPFPQVTDAPPGACEAASKKPGYFQFLDNLCDEKIVPSAPKNTAWSCPNVHNSAVMKLANGSSAGYVSAAVPLVVHSAPLQALGLPKGLKVAVILVRRVNGKPHYRAMGQGHAIALQPWSTTKHIAAANAASMMRIKSKYKVGLTAKVGKHAVGDLVTSLVNYDASPYSSNALGAWFHDIGGRDRANALIHELWLKRPKNETFGGNYGAKPPAIGYHFKEASGTSLQMTANTKGWYANKLSMFTLAESMRRLVLHREEPTFRLPGLQWKDIEVLLYGAQGSKKAGGWGGLSADTAIYMQSGYDMAYLEKRAAGQWRIFSKLGLGTKGQFLDVAYGCFPALDSNGAPIPDLGREVIIATHLDEGGGSWAGRDRLLAKSWRKIIKGVIEGTL